MQESSDRAQRDVVMDAPELLERQRLGPYGTSMQESSDRAQRNAVMDAPELLGRQRLGPYCTSMQESSDRAQRNAVMDQRGSITLHAFALLLHTCAVRS